MRIHHLNCGSIRIFGGIGMTGTGPMLGRAPAVIHCLLVESGDGLVLVDTGPGTRDYERPAALNRIFIQLAGLPRDPAETAIAQVERLGFARRDVRHIVLTHFHFDHVGGLPDFPDATVHVYETEYEGIVRPRDLVERLVFRREHWAHGPGWRVHPRASDTWFGLAATSPVDLGGTEFVFVPLPGHTRGHCGVAIRTAKGWLLHCGDAYIYHGDVDPVQPRRPRGYYLWRPFWMLSYPFRAIGRHSKRLRALRRDHGDEVQLTCSHDPVELEKFLAR